MNTIQRSLVILSGVFVLTLGGVAEAKEIVVFTRSGKANEMRFDPENVSIQPGDTVKWQNDTEIFHSVKSETVPEGAKQFNGKGLFKKGDTWSYTFTDPGQYKYFCVPHRGMGMVGTVTVAKK